jgi:hypothetical protein
MTAYDQMRVNEKAMSRFSRSFALDSATQCWIWTANTDPMGYARFSFKNKDYSGHRVSWYVSGRTVPEGMVIDHICHTPACVNPSHLRLASRKQNQEHRLPTSTRATSGYRNIIRWRGGWMVRVGHNKRTYSKGPFKTLEQAIPAAADLRNALYTHNDFDRVREANDFVPERNH